MSSKRGARIRRGHEITLSAAAWAKIERLAAKQHGGNRSAAIEAWALGLLLVATVVLVGCGGADGGAIESPMVAAGQMTDPAPALVAEDAGSGVDAETAADDAGARGHLIVTESGDAGAAGPVVVAHGPPDASWTAPMPEAGSPQPSDAGPPPACLPQTCGATSCGRILDGCGGIVDCGCGAPTCSAGANGCVAFWDKCPTVEVTATSPTPMVDTTSTTCIVGAASFGTTKTMYLCPNSVVDLGAAPGGCVTAPPEGESAQACQSATQIVPGETTFTPAYWCKF